MKIRTSFTILTAFFCFMIGNTGLAQQTAKPDVTHSHTNSQSVEAAEGGLQQIVSGHHIKTTMMDKGIMFQVSGPDGKIIKAANATGKIALKVDGSDKTYEYQLQPLKNGAMGVAVDLSTVKSRVLHLDVQLNALTTEPLRFQVMIEPAGHVSDGLLISLQKTCPISGKALGSMGQPPKVMVGDKPLFVCCAGCTAKVQQSGEVYVKQFYQAKGVEVRPGVFDATIADATAIAAQRKCPVMDEPLGGMGAPQKVNVKGKSVFICCAGCAKKLAAEPERYLSVLESQGVIAPDFK